MGKKKSSKKADNRGYATSSQPKAKKTGESIKESAASGSSGSPPVVSTTTEPKLTVKEEQKINSKISKALKDLAGDPDIFKLDDDIANWLKSSDQDVPVLRLESRMEHELVSVLRDIGAVRDIDAESLTRPLNLSDQRLLRKLNYTYLALQRLEFQNQDIETAMKSSESWDLERALEWLCLHLPLERLPKRFADKMYYESENTVTVMKSKSRRSGEGPSSPSNFDAPPIKAPQARKSDIDESWKKDILSRFEYENESESEEDLDDRLSLSKTSQNPNLLYADYKVEMVSLQSLAKGEAGQTKKIEIDSMVRDIRGKLEAIRQHKSFSMVEAESEFRKRIKAKHAQQKTTPNSSTSTIFAPDSLDDEQDGLPSSLFSEAPAPIAHSPFRPKKLIVRQLYFSGWTGKVPKQLLNDTLKREDSKCKITYSEVRTPGGLFRSKCVVKSGKGEITEYSMIDKGDATETKQEAEHYAATLALHGIAKGRPLYRMLPPTYKDLWLEWDSKKESDMMDDKRAVDEQRIHFLLSLMDIVKRFKSAGQPSSDLPKSLQQVAGPKSTLRTSSGNLIGEFEKRQAKDSYRKLLKQRQALPVNQYKSEIIRLINQNRVVLISGQTGSGKSTQIPQFILEDLILQGRDHETHIICTQPRRISAMSISSRVSEEMGDKRVGELVGYSIRLMSKVSSMTKLVFSTMGVLLRRLESDVTLEGVSHVIVDEVHERSMESDFLLCVLRKVMARRPDLKIVLMSATLEADRFSAYFDNCPILDIPGRTFPVDVKYLEDAVEMTSYMLEEDSEYSRRIQRSRKDLGTVALSGRGGSTYQQQLELEEDETATYPEDQAPLLSDYSKSTQKMLRRMDPFKINYDLIAHLLENICVMKEEYRRVNGAILIFLPGLMEIRRCLEIIRSFSAFRDTNDYWVLPLHSSLSISDQQKVFEIPPLGVRKIVLTTNIAETGVTIPDVVFVIDTGKAKQLEYDERRQVTSLQESFISQANCKQRRGRAGRVQAGFCFHLFSRYRYDNQMSAYQKPEVLRLPLDQLCIKIKQYGFADLRQFFNELIDAPQTLAVTNAITRLQIVQALDSNENLTPLGHHLGQLPVDVQLGKMLIFGSVFKCLDPIITIVACLNVKSPFVTPFGKETEADAAREKFMLGNSDLLTMYNAYNQWRDVYRQSPSNSRDFCFKNFLSYYNLTMIEETKKQFLDLLISAKFIRISEDTSTRNNSSTLCSAPSEYNTHSSDLKVITATITAGLQPNILLLSNPSATKPILSAAHGAVNIHPSSVHFRRFQNYDPLTAMSSYPSPWFTYYTKVRSSKTYVWDCTSTGSLPVFLFSRDIQVEYAKKTVILDKWVQIKCYGKTAVHLILLRKQLDNLLKRRIGNPDIDLSENEQKVLDVLVRIINSEQLYR